jgi:hypothetical protein
MHDRSDLVRVRNGTDKAIKGRYDGRDYVWKPGAHLDVPLIVARHVFGFGADDKAMINVFHNLGWARTTDDLEVAQERMKLITFSEPPELVEKETGNVRPLVNAGGDSGRGKPILPPPDEPSGDEGEVL